MFQRVCDKYPLQVNIKGGHRPFFGRDIHICSNFLPSRWWGEKTKFDERAIFRRIHIVHWHYEFKKYKLYRHTMGENGEVLEMAMEKFMAEYSKTLYNPVVNHLTGNNGE